MEKKYGIYLATVIATGGENDSRTQIRILPYMQDIPDEQCPLWPCFFKNEVITGSVGELVWVICDEDFTIGYVLGLANKTAYVGEDYSAESIPDNFKEAVNSASHAFFISTRREVSFSNALISYWDKDCVHLVDKNSGASYICYRNGTIMEVSKNSIFFSVGGSNIKIDASGITLKAKNISLGSDDVKLGNGNQGYVMVAAGSTSGKNSVPSTCVQA